MAIIDENGTGTTMLVQPAGFGGGNGGNGFMDGSGWWILLLFILLGGWGNNGLNGSGGGVSGMYPWMNQSNQISEGFQNQMLNDNITGIQNSLNGISTQLFNNQMADLERSFAVQSALQNCCCQTQTGIADLKYTVATENCADRTQSMINTRDIIDSQTRGIQTIMDKLCALELDGVKNQLAQAQRENVGLQNQLNMATLRESQTAQNAFIQQGFANEVDQLYNRLNSCPVPSTPVYGKTPIFTCGGNGCGCGGAFAA